MMTKTIRAALAATLLGSVVIGGAALAHDRLGGGPGDGPGRGLDFAAIDTDANGTLSRAELEARATARIGGIDTNGDGFLERAEIVEAMPGPRGGMMGVFRADPAEERADRMLAMMGATEAGRVEVTVLTARQVDGLLARLDSDRDGAISKDEVAALETRRGDRRGAYGERGERGEMDEHGHWHHGDRGRGGYDGHMGGWSRN
jgi:Ca2+-binding EF-hand superfamily protein